MIKFALIKSYIPTAQCNTWNKRKQKVMLDIYYTSKKHTSRYKLSDLGNLAYSKKGCLTGP